MHHFQGENVENEQMSGGRSSCIFSFDGPCWYDLPPIGMHLHNLTLIVMASS